MLKPSHLLQVSLKWCVALHLTALVFPLAATAQVKPTEKYIYYNRYIYTGSEIPGDPENGVKVLERFFGYTKIFQLNTVGKPSADYDIVSDFIKNPKSYGFSRGKDAALSLVNVDNRYNDDPFLRPGKSSIVDIPTLLDKRPNGQSVGSIKEKGERDVISYSKTYVHSNGGIVSLGFPLSNPVGFYQVLFANGEIERVSYDRELFVYDVNDIRGGLAYTRAFPGQAGVPYNTLTYEEAQAVVFSRDARPFPPLGYRTLKRNQFPEPDKGEAEGLLNLLRRWQPNVERIQIWDALEKFGVDSSPFSDLIPVASELGLNAELQKLSWEELGQPGVPVMMLLPKDGRIMTVLAVSGDLAVIVDRGRTFVTSLAQSQKLFGDARLEVLVPTKALAQNAAIVADDAVREVELPSLDAEVEQQFVLHNTGTAPMTLQLEYPLPGVTASKLSRDTLAPGETATLDLKVKWRSILKAPYQNVLVSVATNDPVVPRLQLAMLLKPPQGQGADN